MDNSFDVMFNSMLEKVARGYNAAKNDWKADKLNPFKDGKFLGYYEAKEAILKVLDADGPVAAAFEEIARRYNAAKADWKADKANPFKDGKLLAYFEVIKLIPAM